MRLLRACFGQPFTGDEQLRRRAHRASHSSCAAHPPAPVVSPRGTARAHGHPQYLVFCSQLLAAADAAPYAVTVLSDVDADGRVHVLSQNERSRWCVGAQLISEITKDQSDHVALINTPHALLAGISGVGTQAHLPARNEATC